MADNELAEVFKHWNPMKSDYENPDNNQYNIGLGTHLANNSKLGKTKYPFLIFHRIPANLTNEGLYNLCSKYGRVTDIRYHKFKNIYFVDFKTIADMEAVYRNLERNSYGFNMTVGRNSLSDKYEQKFIDKEKIQHNMKKMLAKNDNTENNPDNNSIDLEKRRIITSKQMHPRPSFWKMKEPIGELLLLDNKSLIALYRLLLNDAHALERVQLNVFPDDEKYHYYAGRSYKIMPNDIKEFIERKLKETSEKCPLPLKMMDQEYYFSSSNSISNDGGSDEHTNTTIKFFECLECNEICDKICARCSMPFCGINCQTMNWTHHGEACNDNKIFNSNKKSILKNMDNETTMPCNRDIVTITAISSINLLFIRSKLHDKNVQYFQNIELLRKLSRKDLKSFNIDQIRINSMALHQTSNRKNVERVRFLSELIDVDNDDLNSRRYVMVLYVDFGNMDRVCIDDLYQIPDIYINMPIMINCVQLKNVSQNTYMTNEIRLFMYTYLQDIDMYIKYTTNDYLTDLDIYQVELIDTITQQNFNEILIKLSTPIPPRRRRDICFYDILERPLLPVGMNINLVVMDNSLLQQTSCISCTLPVYAHEIEKFQKDLQCYGEKMSTKKRQEYTPRFGELCIAKYEIDGKWYRGQSIEVAGDGYPTILFIDYGNICHISIENIVPYPEQFTFPIYTCDCEIDGLPLNADDVLLKKVQDLIPNGSLLKCNVTKVENETNYYKITSATIKMLLRRITSQHN